MRPTGKHDKLDQEQALRRDLRRDRTFRTQLSRQLGVEKPPAEFHAAMQKTLLELPDQLPTRYRPVRDFLRRSAVALATVALLFLGLMGVNSTYPQITEALPGLGFVFRSINGGEKVPVQPVADASPSPSPTPQPTEEPPRFQPVTVYPAGSDRMFPGDLTIDNAWSDGKYLYLDLSIGFGMDVELGEIFKDTTTDKYGNDHPMYELIAGIGNYIADATWEIADYFEIYVDGVNRSADVGRIGFVSDGSGRVTAQLGLELEGADPTLNVELYLPNLSMFLYGPEGAECVDTWQAFFDTKFEVEVDTTRNQIFYIPATDNQVTLENVTYTPSYVEIEATLPYIGLDSEMLIPFNGAPFPLGAYATLTQNAPLYTVDMVAARERGQRWWNLYENVGFEVLDNSVGEALDYPERYERRNTCRFTFKAEGEPLALDAPLVLTFYETPEEAEEHACRRVLAEFSIDLAAGTITPSENYKQGSHEKLDPDRKAVPRPSFTNGFICNSITLVPTEFAPMGQGEHITLLTPGWESRNLQINAYYMDEEGNEMLGDTFEFTTGLGQFYGDNFYGDNFYYEESTYTVNNDGDIYKFMTIIVYYTQDKWDYSGDIQRFAWMELMDADTGEVLIGNLGGAMVTAHTEALGNFVDYSQEIEGVGVENGS